MVVVAVEETLLTPEGLARGLADSGLPNLWRPAPNSLLLVEALPQLGAGKPDLVSIRRMAGGG